MKPSDKTAFGTLLTDVLSFYGQAITPFALSVWWNACQGCEIEQVRKALTAHAMDPDRGHFPPKPADLVRQLHGTSVDRSLVAWGKVHDAIGQVGAYQSVVFDDGAIHAAIVDMGGWTAVCRTLVDDLPFVQKRFCDLHRTYSVRPDLGAWPAKLLGEFELTNRLAGQEVAPPVLIGDPGRARQVLLTGSTAPKTPMNPFQAVVDRAQAALPGAGNA